MHKMGIAFEVWRISIPKNDASSVSTAGKPTVNTVVLPNLCLNAECVAPLSELKDKPVLALSSAGGMRILPQSTISYTRLLPPSMMNELNSKFESKSLGPWYVRWGGLITKIATVTWPDHRHPPFGCLTQYDESPY
jgi:hypothetical protein